MFIQYIFDHDIAAGHSRCDHESPRFDTVRNDCMSDAFQLLDTFDTDDIRPCAFDVCTHGIQERHEIHDLRLFRCIFNDGTAFCRSSCHEDILCRTDTREIEINGRALQPLRCISFDIAVAYIDLCPHSFKGFQVQIDRTAADHAAPGKRDLRMPHLGQKRSHDQERGSHAAHKLIRSFGLIHPGCIKSQDIVLSLDFDAQRLQYTANGHHIIEIRCIDNGCRCLRQKCRYNDRKNGILCAGNTDVSTQGMSTMNY